MKLTLPILAGLLVAAPLGAQNIKINLDPAKPADTAPAAKPAQAAPTAPQGAEKQELIAPVDGKYTDAQKMEVYGFMMANRVTPIQQAAALIGSKDELVGFLNGIGTAMTNGSLPYDPKVMGPQVQTMIQARAEIVKTQNDKMLAELKEKNSKEAATYLVTLDSKPNVKKSASGLRYEIIQEGKGPKAKPEQAVRGYYQTTFINGEVLASSKGQDGKDVVTEIPLGPLLPGLKEGLQLVGVGGKVKLYIPAELAFGDKGMFPGALTIFEMEILEVKEPTKQPDAPAATK